MFLCCFLFRRKVILTLFISKVGEHRPHFVELEIYGSEFIFDDCPELTRYLDHTQTTIEMWKPSGHFRLIHPFRYTAYDKEYAPFIILRPGGQPEDYLKNCIGFRELSYELFYLQVSFSWTPIVRGLAPVDESQFLVETGPRLQALKKVAYREWDYLEEDDGYIWVSDFPDDLTAKFEGPWVWDEAEEYNDNDYLK